MDEVKAFFERQKWIFANTYAHKAPHEYIVRDNIVGTDEEFMGAVVFILKNGITIGRKTRLKTQFSATASKGWLLSRH